MEILGLLLVFAALVGILLFMLRGMRSGHGAARTLRGFTRYRGPEHGGALAAAIVFAFASGHLYEGTALVSAGAAGATLGLIVAIGHLIGPLAFDVVLVLLSIGGITSTVIDIANGSGCDSSEVVTRLVPYLVLSVVAALAAVVTSLFGGFRLRSVGGFFAATEVIAFFASPLGISLFAIADGNGALGVVGWLVGILVAVLLGSLGTRYPNAVLQLAAVAVAITSIATGVIVGDACGNTDWASVVNAIAAAVVFLLVTGVANLVRGR